MTAVVVQADGKIVVAGTTSLSGSATGSNFALARYNTSGSLDTAFDGDGKVITDFGTKWDNATSVAIQVIGGQTKIVVGGHTNSGSGSQDFTLARYNTSGSLDATFDGYGKVTTDMGSIAADYDEVRTVLICPDGSILAVGPTAFDVFYHVALARYRGV